MGKEVLQQTVIKKKKKSYSEHSRVGGVRKLTPSNLFTGNHKGLSQEQQKHH